MSILQICFVIQLSFILLSCGTIANSTQTKSESQELLKVEEEAKIIQVNDPSWEVEKINSFNEEEDFIDVISIKSQFPLLFITEKPSTEGVRRNIYQTTDKGISWKKLSTIAPQNFFASKLFALDESKIWLLVQKESNTKDFPEAQIWLTENFGKTWKQIYVFENTYVNDFTFNKFGEGWLSGVQNKSGVVFHTIDFGYTWKDISPQSNNYLVHLQQTGQQEILASSASGQILTSKDAGETWKDVVTLPLDKFSFFRSTKINDKKILAVKSGDGISEVWTQFTVVNQGNIEKNYILNKIVLTDFLVLESGEVLACGKKNSINMEKKRIEENSVILTSKDYQNWNLLYEKPGITHENDLSSGKLIMFNKVVNNFDGTFLIAGDNGVFIMLKKLADT